MWWRSWIVATIAFCLKNEAQTSYQRILSILQWRLQYFILSSVAQLSANNNKSLLSQLFIEGLSRLYSARLPKSIYLEMATCALPCTQFGLFLYNFLIAVSPIFIHFISHHCKFSFNLPRLVMENIIPNNTNCYLMWVQLSGWIILIVGIWTQNSFNDYADFVGDAGYSVAELMIIFGGIAFVVAFFGCCVAIEQSPSMIRSVSGLRSIQSVAYKWRTSFLLQFVVCLVGIIIFEIGIGFAGILKYKELDNTLKRGFNRTLINYQDNQPAWKLVQTNVWCHKIYFVQVSINWRFSNLL